MAEPVFTPVNLITGFLGSGKTTLLQRLLADPALADTAVLINEFGEVGLDHHLLERIDDTMVLLQSGCLCCTIRGELSAAIKDLHSKRERGQVPPFRRLVVESTGLADPFPILSTVQADPVLRHHFRLGNVITTVDAVNGMAAARAPARVHQAGRRRRPAGADQDRPCRCRHATDALERAPAPAQSVGAAVACGRGAARCRGAAVARLVRDRRPQRGGAALVRGGARAARRRAGRTIATGTTRPSTPSRSVFDGPLDWTLFGLWLTMLLNRHGEQVLRVKGILNVAEPATPVAVHGVQHLVHPPVHMAAWPDDDRRSRLVFIVDGLDRGLIERSLRAFLRLGRIGRPAICPRASASRDAREAGFHQVSPMPKALALSIRFDGEQEILAVPGAQVRQAPWR